jgi:beta-catenin-like protein 1
LDAGLFCLQTIDVILAWLVAEDDGASKRIQSLLADHDESLAVVKATIQGELFAQHINEMVLTILQNN